MPQALWVDCCDWAMIYYGEYQPCGLCRIPPRPLQPPPAWTACGCILSVVSKDSDTYLALEPGQPAGPKDSGRMVEGPSRSSPMGKSVRRHHLCAAPTEGYHYRCPPWLLSVRRSCLGCVLNSCFILHSARICILAAAVLLVRLCLNEWP